MMQETQQYSQRNDVPATAEIQPLLNPEATNVDMVPFLRVLFRGRKIIISSIVLGTIAGLVIAFLAPPYYTAESSFLVGGTPGGGASALASQLGALGGASALGLGKSPGDTYLGIIKSHAVLGNMVQKFDLKKAFHVDTEYAAEQMLFKETKLDPGLRSSIVLITVTDKSATRARDLANGFLDSVQLANETLAITEASQRRSFYEKQLQQEKEALANAEVDLKKTQEKTGLILPSGQAATQIDTIARVRAEITSREVQLSSLRNSSTEQNPIVISLHSEIADLQHQLNVLESGKQTAGNIPTSQVPELALETIRKEREVKYHETLFSILARQYETARLDESKDGPELQILDRATLPERKSGPSRLLILLACVVMSGLTGVTCVFALANQVGFRRWIAANFSDLS